MKNQLGTRRLAGEIRWLRQPAPVVPRQLSSAAQEARCRGITDPGTDRLLVTGRWCHIDKNDMINSLVPEQTYLLVSEDNLNIYKLNKFGRQNFQLVFTRGQFWPSGIVIACVCVSVRVSVCVCINHLLVRTITHQPFTLESPNLDERRKTPWLRCLLFLGVIDWDLQGQI